MSSGNITTPYLQVTPCVSPGEHNFRTSHPPAGMFGHALTVCTRCGSTPEQVRK